MDVSQLFLLVALLFAGTIKINGSDNVGRLLTPQEGCGIQPPERMFLMDYYRTWPWVGSMLHYSSETRKLSAKCTATLITSRHALTTANCVINNNPLYVRFGELRALNTHYFNTTEHDEFLVIDESFTNMLDIFNDYMITHSVIHPKAKTNALENNLAILFLATDVPFSDRMRPACLPQSPSIFNERISNLFRIVHVDSSDVAKASTLKSVKYVQTNTELCSLVNSVTLSDKTAFCADGPRVLGAEGDPVVAKVKEQKASTPVYQVGINVFNLKKSQSEIFLHLYPYYQWIKNTVNGN